MNCLTYDVAFEPKIVLGYTYDVAFELNIVLGYIRRAIQGHHGIIVLLLFYYYYYFFFALVEGTSLLSQRSDFNA